MPDPISPTAYFSGQKPPTNLDETTAKVKAFVERMTAEGKRVVLVTSGGTSVPLEQNMVRFLDNFSAGTRGATSAEYFLENDYAVIFMHRQHSLLPFSRHYSHSTHPFLDLLQISADDSTISVNSSETPTLLPILKRHLDVKRRGLMLSIPFVTVNEYLWMLRAVSEQMASAGRQGMFYLAAAVSDFFLPPERMSEHKIQSSTAFSSAETDDGRLTLTMDQVPKILRPLVQEWAHEGYIVSFKLETDPELLLPKARGALVNYGHQLVIGNDLHRRKFEVVFVEPEGKEQWVRLSEEALREGKEIEEVMVRELIERHTNWIA